jgi:hypothetical protein
MDPVAFYTHGLCALPHQDAELLPIASPPEHVRGAFRAPRGSTRDVVTHTRFRVWSRVGDHRVPVGPVHTLAVKFAIGVMPQGQHIQIDMFGNNSVLLTNTRVLNLEYFFQSDRYFAPHGNTFAQCRVVSTLPAGQEHAYAPLVAYAILEMLHTAYGGDLRVKFIDRLPPQSIRARLWNTQTRDFDRVSMSPMLLMSADTGTFVSRLDFWEIIEDTAAAEIRSFDHPNEHHFMWNTLNELDSTEIVTFVKDIMPQQNDDGQVRLHKFYIAPLDPENADRTATILRDEQRTKTMLEIHAETWARHVARGWTVPAIKHLGSGRYKTVTGVLKMLPRNPVTETPNMLFAQSDEGAAGTVEADIYHVLTAIGRFSVPDDPNDYGGQPLSVYDERLAGTRIEVDPHMTVDELMHSMRTTNLYAKVHQIMNAAAIVGDNLPANAFTPLADDGEPGARRLRMFTRLKSRASVM